ncbi:hypothetical protein NE236_07155 [Actinoallomurus purpureus]|uniref:hypothetical protein n=1 Tax=Actinoallomurus purpureus TaxID=478114 RepID=UPI0020930A60|nr:hypothetical protein [Actinoallomurus purpureus]MCO6004752.1 hypothetical protein [Actinoallomurus purpureus]
MTETFDTAYEACLDDDAQRLYRLLSRHPGPDITPSAAAALIDTTEQAATLLLEQLVEFHLLQEEQGRYFFGDLAYDHACATAKKYESKDDPLEAFTRLAYWYLRRATAAQRAVIPDRWYLGRVFTEPLAVEFDEITALEWSAVERHNLLAIIDVAHKLGLHTVAWQIAEAMWALFVRRRHYDTWVSAYEIGYKAALTAGDLEAQAHMLQGQASAWLGRCHFGHAKALSAQALELAMVSGHRHAEATSLGLLGRVHLGREEHADAVDHFDAAREIYRELGDERGVFLMTRHKGEAELAAGNYRQAEIHLDAVERWCRQANEPYLLSRCLGPLGRLFRLTFRYSEAGSALQHALELSRKTGAHQQQAEILVELADLADDTGETDLEQRDLREAHAIYAELGALEAAAVADRLLPETE